MKAKYLAGALLLMTFSAGVIVCAGESEKESKIVGSISVAKTKRADFLKLARITLPEANAIALKQFPGDVRSSGIENEDGYLVYSVEVVSKSNLHEILVDAGNGKILADQTKSAAHKEDSDDDEENDDD